MIKESVTVDEVIKMLNEMLSLDRGATEALIHNRVLCNISLANHPTIQVMARPQDHNYRVGIIGVLNGLFGINNETGMGAIVMVYDDDGALIGFERNK